MEFPIAPMPSMPVTSNLDSASPLSKRRKFTPPNMFGTPFLIQSTNNSSIEHHTFSSPILPQLSSQAPTPDEVEASLLEVGMRVRKSVSDGYKISPQKKFTPRPFANNLSRLSPETQKALVAGNMNESKPLEPYHGNGLQDVATMAMQPLATATFCGINLSALAWSGDDWSSSGISEQALWSYSTSHKRGYEADSDSDESQDWLPQTPTLAPENGASMGWPADYFNIGCGYDMNDVSIMAQPGEKHGRGRRMARPRTRVPRNSLNQVAQSDMQMPPSSVVNPFASINIEMMQQHRHEDIFQRQSETQRQFPDFVPMGHRRLLSCGMEANMDFGDASFLEKREDVEMDCS